HEGASVETARDAHEAIALMRQTAYSAALVDIRLPDMDGYEAFKRLREVQPGVPIILMTGFGYDPSHSIVKARQEGLQTVLYKPLRRGPPEARGEQGPPRDACTTPDARDTAKEPTPARTPPPPPPDDPVGRRRGDGPPPPSRRSSLRAPIGLVPRPIPGR